MEIQYDLISDVLLSTLESVQECAERASAALLNLIYIILIYRLRGGNVLISIEKLPSICRSFQLRVIFAFSGIFHIFHPPYLD